MRSAILLIGFLCLSLSSFALKIKGRVYDAGSNLPLEGVEVLNIYSGQSLVTDSTGLFEIAVEAGQLLEFRTLGYDIARVRIANGALPEFYNIGMKVGAITLEEVKVWELGRGKWGSDSARTAATYENILKHYKLEGLDLLQHPFDALSKSNRQIWAFQKHYEFFEKEKYIDYTFNERLIGQLTQLSGDSVVEYMHQYRPGYDALRRMNLYEFYDYIQKTVAQFRMQQGKRED